MRSKARLARTALLPVVAIALIVALSAPERVAQAAPTAPIVIATGRKGGAYYYTGDRLQIEMALRHGVLVDVATSRGSLNNLALLSSPDSPVNLALTQADALQLFLAEHPDFGDSFFVLGDVGKECAFLIASARGGVETASDLAALEGAEISVDDMSSGGAVTWEFLSQRAPAFAKLEPVSVPTTEALLQLKMASSFSKVRAAILVARPKRVTKTLRVVVDSPDALRFVPIVADDVPNANLPNGTTIYTFEKVKLGGEANTRAEIETVCTSGLLIGSKRKLSIDLRDKLAELMLEAPEKVVGQAE